MEGQRARYFGRDGAGAGQERARESGPWPKLIAEPVEVEMAAPAGGVYAPARFTWRGRTLAVEHVLRVFAEADWPRTVRTRGWWLKRRHTHWIVRAADGHVYQLRLDRTGRRRQWVLLKQLE
jgi:hypothetical protein